MENFTKNITVYVFSWMSRHSHPFTYSLLLLLTHLIVMHQVNLTFLMLRSERYIIIQVKTRAVLNRMGFFYF